MAQGRGIEPLWSCPQTVFKTTSFIRGELERFGIEYRTVDETRTFGKIVGNKSGNADGKTVLLRADIDALPIKEETGLSCASKNEGVMHACGHDFHTSALLGAAKALSRLRDSFDGTVLLAFQQAEEYGHGSKFFVKEGLTKGYDRAFSVHIAPFYPVGTVALTNGPDSASCDYFKISVKGKPAHISKPHYGKNALLAAAEIASALTKLHSTFLNPIENAVIGIGTLHAGSSWNIIAKEAVLEGTIRTFSHEVQTLLINKITEQAKAIAGLYETEAEVEFENFTPSLINDEDSFKEAYRVSAELLGEKNIVTDSRSLLDFGADDFAEFIRYEKGVYVHVGAANDDENSRLTLHNSRLTPDEGALKIAAELYLRYALSVLI